MSGIILASMWMWHFGGLAQAAAGASGAGQAKANVQTQVISVAESRFRDLTAKPKKPGTSDGDSFATSFSSAGWGRENALTVTLELRGPAVANATHYGKVNIARATTDPGNAEWGIPEMRNSEYGIRNEEGGGVPDSAFRIPHSAFPPDSASGAPSLPGFALALAGDYRVGLADPRSELVYIDRDAMNFGQPEASADRITVDIRFDPPPRNATRIAELTGGLELRTGEPREVLVEGIAAAAARVIENAALAEARLNVEIVDPAQKGGFLISGEPGKAVTLKVSGDLDALLDVDLVSGSGEPLYASQMTSTGEGSSMIVLEDDAALPPDAKLKLSVAVGGKTVAVPFAFKDIPLP